MPRARSASIVRLGAERPGGQRPWRVTAYASDDKHPNGRVRFKLETGAWTQRTPEPGQTLDQLFDQIEAAVTAQVRMAVRGVEHRDINALCDRYDRWMVSEGKADTTITKNRNLMKLYIRPVIGKVLVTDWSPDHTRNVRDAAAHVSPSRREDLGTVLSGMRGLAHEKYEGARWLSPTENPMENVSFSRKGGKSGQHHSYVEPSKRPSDKQVATAIEAARIRGEIIGVPTLPLLVEIACKCGPRQGELFALRGMDTDLEKRLLSISGSWCQPRGHNGKKPYRKATKTNVERVAPFPRSLAPKIAARLAELDSPEDWLVPHTGTGMPWNKESFNDEWHRIQRLTAKLAKDDPERYAAWPRSIPFRNCRHYAATWWHSKGLEWKTVAHYLGNSIRTVENHYVRVADNVDEETKGKLDND